MTRLEAAPANKLALHDRGDARGALWRHRDLAGYAAAHIQGLASGSATDWGMGGGNREARRPPISLAGGIPDAATQPREALLEAMRRALDTPDDAPLVYGGGHGYEPLREEIARFFARDQSPVPGADRILLTTVPPGRSIPCVPPCSTRATSS